MQTDFDIIVVGAGLTGLTAAITLSQSGLKTALVDAETFGPQSGKPLDPRASTLAASSYQFMQNIGLDLKSSVQPINDMMIGEGRPGKISPLTLHFDGQSRTQPMAYMIENALLLSALQKAASARLNLSLKLGERVTGFNASNARAELTLESGETLFAKLIIGADGRGSAVRRAATIAVDSRPYGQSAITATVEHEKEHGGVAYQMFFSGGPFAILPLTGRRCSLVWSDKTDAVKAALSLSSAEFTAEAARRFGDHLGEINVVGPKLSYPLHLQMAERYTSSRLALIGDAAHVVHPIAGQGLNMGLRDVAVLAEVITRARAAGLDIGGAELEHYAQWRRGDNRTLGLVTDQLNTLFSNRIAPLRHIRRLGLAAVDRSAAMRGFFMSEAAGEIGDLPPLMRSGGAMVGG